MKKEVKQLWGDETVEKSNDFIASKSDRERKDMEKILMTFSEDWQRFGSKDPDSDPCPGSN